MRKLTRYLLVGAAAIAFAPTHALAAEVVPPGNSGVNQYTETVPTAGGNVAIKHQGIRQPKQALGKEQARKLEEKGPEGKAAAELAATGSAPAGAGGGDTTPAPAGKGGGGKEGGDEERPVAAGGGSGGSSGGSNTGRPGRTTAGPAVGGPSGLGQVVGQATGSSSGELGPLMPIVLLAALAWCAAFAWRRRRDHA